MSEPLVAPEGATAAQFLYKKWGGPTRATPNTAIALNSGAATRVANNNPRRIGLILINASTANMTIGNSAADATSGGLLLAPLGGSITLSADEDGEWVTYEWWVICPTLNTNVNVIEVMGV